MDHGTEIIDFVVVDNDRIIVDHEYIIIDFFVDHNTYSEP